MIEAVGNESNDIGAATFMICMTAGAFRGPRVRKPAVKSNTRLDVRRNILVAVATQRALPVFREGHVTLIAVGLQLFMALDELAGQDQALQVNGGGIACQSNQNQCHD